MRVRAPARPKALAHGDRRLCRRPAVEQEQGEEQHRPPGTCRTSLGKPSPPAQIGRLSSPLPVGHGLPRGCLDLMAQAIDQGGPQSLTVAGHAGQRRVPIRRRGAGKARGAAGCRRLVRRGGCPDSTRHVRVGGQGPAQGRWCLTRHLGGDVERGLPRQRHQERCCRSRALDRRPVPSRHGLDHELERRIEGGTPLGQHRQARLEPGPVAFEGGTDQHQLGIGSSSLPVARRRAHLFRAAGGQERLGTQGGEASAADRPARERDEVGRSIRLAHGQQLAHPPGQQVGAGVEWPRRQKQEPLQPTQGQGRGILGQVLDKLAQRRRRRLAPQGPAQSLRGRLIPHRRRARGLERLNRDAGRRRGCCVCRCRRRGRREQGPRPGLGLADPWHHRDAKRQHQGRTAQQHPRRRQRGSCSSGTIVSTGRVGAGMSQVSRKITPPSTTTSRASRKKRGSGGSS